ncbi:MAG TPA: iron-containing alcohol dehydrogenase [Bacillota bacterium]
MLPEFLDFSMRTRVMGAPGLVRELGDQVSRIGGTRAFVVADRTLEKLGLVGRAVNGLTAGGVAVAGQFLDVPPNSDVGVVEQAAAAAGRAGGDVLVAIGGGSVIDTAKGMNMILSKGGSLMDYQGLGLVNDPLGKLVAVPTTAGTGSEVTNMAVIKDPEARVKYSFTSPYLGPDLAILDPEVTVGLPPQLTASTGMDALTHAVEAYLSLSANPVSDALALYATKVVRDWLPKATHEGSNVEARYWMLIGSNTAGAAFSNALVGCVHAMAHALGGLFSIPHGLANAVLLAPGLEFNLDFAAARIAELAPAFRLAPAAAEEATAKAVVEAVKALAKECGLPDRLRDLGVPPDGLEAAAEAAAADGAIFTNPRPATAEELLEVLKRVF